jgi:hypothetical protein
MADYVSVLATQAQRAAEKMALWLIEQPSARAARERSRAILLEDAVAEAADGGASLERSDASIFRRVVPKASARPTQPQGAGTSL